MFFVFRKKAKAVEGNHDSIVQRAAQLVEDIKAADEHADQQASHTVAAITALSQELGRIQSIRQKLKAIDIKF